MRTTFYFLVLVAILELLTVIVHAKLHARTMAALRFNQGQISDASQHQHVVHLLPKNIVNARNVILLDKVHV